MQSKNYLPFAIGVKKLLNSLTESKSVKRMDICHSYNPILAIIFLLQIILIYLSKNMTLFNIFKIVLTYFVAYPRVLYRCFFSVSAAFFKYFHSINVTKYN